MSDQAKSGHVEITGASGPPTTQAQTDLDQLAAVAAADELCRETQTGVYNWGYRVTGTIDFTIDTDTPEEATAAAHEQIIAMLQESPMLPTTRGSHYDRNALTVTKIEYTAEELAETERWMTRFSQ